MIAVLDRPQTPLVETNCILSKVSASRLNCFLTCRLKFYFRYVLKLVKPSTGPLFVGRVVHNALKRWSKARWLGLPHDTETLKPTFLTDWTLSQQEEPVEWEQDEEEKQQGKAWDLVDIYLRDTPIPAEEKPEAVEVSVEADLPGLPRLIGIIDLIRPGGKIVDFKTSAATPQPDQAIHRNETQLTAYGILYREATGEEASGFELHHLIKTKQPKLVVTEVGALTDGRETKFLRAVESYVEGVEREDYVPSPGLQCASCEFFNECSMWNGKS